ncbi:MAG: hypothetical protein WHF31_16165 [Candidatus Dehalobacter alkaniphilus]|jgi:hypothetical protein
MSRAIRSYPKEERKSVINRRLAQPEEKQGLGYWAARDATKGVSGNEMAQNQSNQDRPAEEA